MLLESNKIHQGENYQNFLKWWGGGGIVFRSFSYNNQSNELEDFFHNIGNLTPLQLGTKE